MSFRPFYENPGLFQKISEGCRRFPMKTLTVFSSETVNIKKLANLTANTSENTKNYGKITPNIKSHSDLLNTAHDPHP